MNPRVAILWLNYNSAPIFHIVEKSLRSLAELDYDNFHVYIIDNGSNDGSIEKICKLVKNDQKLRSCSTIVRLGTNLGFTGAIDVVWQHVKDLDFNYLALLNNDVIVEPESLKKLVEFLEARPDVCGVQGILLLGGGRKVDCFGCYVDSLLESISFMYLHNVDEVPRRGLYVTYCTGAYSLYNIQHLKQITTKTGDLFPKWAFAYWDDDYLGMKGWTMGYKFCAIPIIAGRHCRSLTFRRVKTLQTYFVRRNYIAKALSVRTIEKFFALYRGIRICLHKGKKERLYLRMLYDGFRLWKKVHTCFDFSRMPIIRYPISEVVKFCLVYRLRASKLDDFVTKQVLENYSFRY